MGIIYTPNILKHWFTDSLHDTQTFQKLWHVCLFTDMNLCRKLYYPKKQLSVGKSLVLLKCQLRFKQYIKTKRVCFGIKLYKLTSSNGTTLNFSVNSRKRMFHNGDENSDMSAPERTLFTNYFFSLIGNTWYTTSFR